MTTAYSEAIILLNLRKDLESLPTGKCGKPNGHAIRKLWIAACDKLENCGLGRAVAATKVEAVTLEFRR